MNVRAQRRAWVAVCVSIAAALVSMAGPVPAAHAADELRPLHRLSVAAICGRRCTRRRGSPRILFVGDSLTTQTTDATKAALATRHWRVQTFAVPGTGLVSDIDPVAWKPVGWDWLSGFRRFVAQQDPDVVVVEFIGVHFPFDSYARMPVGSAAFHDAWLRAANEAMAILTSRGATVYWVVPPPMRDKWWADQTDVVRDITRGLAKGWPPAPGRDGVQYIDEFQPFQLGGAYAEALPGPDGRLVTVRRRSDGVHLADAGIQRYVDRLVGVLERYDTGRFRVA